MSRLTPWVFWLACLAFPFSALDAVAFSCGSRVVSAGDSKAEVVMKCGEPAWKDSHEEEITERPDADTKRKTTITVDEWIYNFGPQSFLRILEFRNGKLAVVKTGGYGYADTGEWAAYCDEQKFKRGDTKIDVLFQCGAPAGKEEWKEEIIEGPDRGDKRKVTVNIEEWTYNLGPSKFMRILTFRNGKLTDIKTGDYGK
jgi:hypothetical protein